MDWKIKEIESKSDFDELEKFYRLKLAKHFHFRLNSDYLFWKLKQNKNFNGVMVVAIRDNKIIGSSSLTFKEAILCEENKLIAEIGDAYVDIKVQKEIMNKYEYKKNEQKFSDISIFGSLTKYLINIAQEKSISLIYGVPNNTSYQGYVKNLNFRKLERLNVFSYSLPCFKSNNDKLGLKKIINLILKLYRNFIFKILSRNFKIIYNDELNINEINKFSEKKNKRFYLNRNQEYFYNKYKFYPESAFKFCKVYKNSELVGIYVLKEDLNNQKIFIVDCLVKKKDKFLIKLVALRSAIDKNLSVNFWEKKSIINFFEKMIFNIFERNKINIIYYDKNNFDQSLFFEEFYIGFSDNF